MFLWAPQVVGGAAQEIFWGEYHKGRGWAGGVMGTEQRPVMMEVDAAVKRSATKRVWEKVRLAVENSGMVAEMSSCSAEKDAAWVRVPSQRWQPVRRRAGGQVCS